MSKTEQVKTLWTKNKRGLIVLAAVATAALAVYTVFAVSTHQKALAETLEANLLD